MSQIIPVPPCNYVVFGGTGDLSMRKLFPALYYREADGQLPEDASVIAVARGDLSQEAFVAQLEEACRRNVAPEYFDNDVMKRFAARFHYRRVDALTPEGYAELAPLLDATGERVRVFYLATAPRLFGAICNNLNEAGLINAATRVVLEKPIGHDLESSCEINDAVGQVFEEHQIYRIDHYLGKETVQNLLALRFGNILFERVWSNAVIDHVQITAAETVGLGDRAGYYNTSGALRDMVQNHLLQLLCLVAMEPPASMDDDAVRDEKMKVLRALQPIDGDDVEVNTVRGQYSGGVIEEQVVAGYIAELGKATDTETFVSLKMGINNWRWSGVPFYLRTGKRLPVKHSEISIQFKPVSHSIFPGGGHNDIPNRLSIVLQPDEGVHLRVMAKKPGPGSFELQPVSLKLSFEETFGIQYPDAYERLIIEVLRGNPALFMRRDEVETAWQWVDNILAGWSKSTQPMETYSAGSWGPTMSTRLLERDGRQWQEPE